MIKIQHDDFPLEEKAFPAILRDVARRLALKGSVTVRLGGEAEVRALNRAYRHKDCATDVLSFPLGERLPGGLYAGDVLICMPLAKKQAKQNGQSLERELLLLMLHGLLHLKGLDHEKDKGEMLALQQRLFAEFSAKLP